MREEINIEKSCKWPVKLSVPCVLISGKLIISKEYATGLSEVIILKYKTDEANVFYIQYSAHSVLYSMISFMAQTPK